MNLQMALCLCLLLVLIPSTSCRSTGAPVQACTTLTPQHSGTAPQTGPSPYRLDVVSGSVYSPAGTVTVRLNSTLLSTIAFRGILLQARQAADGTLVGSWQFPAGGDFQYVPCVGAEDQSTITHTGNATKTLPVAFTWNAPTQSVGDVEFLVSVVQQFTTYWTNVRASVVPDTVAPVFDCPTQPYQEMIPLGSTTVLVTWPTPTATDNSEVAPNVTLQDGSRRPGLFSQGVYEITYEARDEAGNVATCTFDVIVADNVHIIPPVFIYCPENIIQSFEVDDTTTGLLITWNTPTAVDNSGIVTVTQIEGPSSGSLFPIGSTNITYEAGDAVAGTAECHFVVTIVAVDNIAPVFECPTQPYRGTIPMGSTTVFVEWSEPAATDNSGIAPTVVLQDGSSGPGQFVAGTHFITYQATDGTGNVDTCTFSVIVTDDDPNEPPLFIFCPQDITLSLNVDGIRTGLVVNWGTPMLLDSSGNITVTQTEGLAPGSLFPIGSTNITYEVSDAAGGTEGSCQFVVTVVAVDNTAPVFDCPTQPYRETIPLGSTNVLVTWPTPTATDNSGVAPDVTLQAGSRGPGMFSMGVYPVTYRAMDGTGNVATCTFLVVVTQTASTTQAQPSYTTESPTIAQSSPYVTDLLTTTKASTNPAQYTTESPTIAQSSPYITDLRTTKEATTEGPASPLSTILVVVICVVVVIVIVLAITLILLCIRAKRRRGNEPDVSDGDRLELAAYENKVSGENETNIPSDLERVVPSEAPLSQVPATMSPSPYEDVSLPSWAQPWTVPWKNMILGDKILGGGRFGEVRLGGVMINDEVSKAAIKTLKGTASPTDRQNFMEGFRTTTKIRRHPKVVNILGACLHDDELYVAMEYLLNGDLRSYLRNARSAESDGQSSLSADKLLHFALDVAEGMHHLVSSGVIHRDLAARNILLSNNLVAKVATFGLSQEHDVHVKMSETQVPTRWLSLESLTTKTYTLKSNVWSYGILLWEIATLGATPYPSIEKQHLASQLAGGYRMPKPRNCANQIYDLMLQCWQEEPNKRPSFKELAAALTTMADIQTDHTYLLQLLPMSERHTYENIRPDLDDN